MPGFNLYTSNRSELLAHHLADIIKQHPLSVFTPETIVVQSRGMARWLTLQLAERLNIWANAGFPFPNHFITDITGKILQDQNAVPLYDRDKAVWQIMSLLSELKDQPWFAPLRTYQQSSFKRYQLALKIADLFDQYTVFRPDLIAAWDQRQGEHWQAELWYQLGRRYQQSNRAVLRNRLLSCLNQQDVSHLLPERISVFGISYFPPFHLSILEGLSTQTEINYFLINPCRHWWGHIMDAGRIAKRIKKEKRSAEELYLEKGNPLLASMGHLGRDFLTMLQDLETEEIEVFEDPGGESMLTVLQRDILDLAESGEGSTAVDESIVVNSCHSNMREIEVLHNHLLYLFENDSSLEPRDIVVMAPDINAYSPLVEAVFEASSNSSRYIPYSIGDQGPTQENPLIPLFLSLLDLAGSRFEVSRVLDILYARQIRKRYDLTEADLEVVRDWINEVWIRWGRDREHLNDMGLPQFVEYCWRSGLDRLLLGVCMSGEGVFSSLAPFNGLEEGDQEILAKAVEALTDIFTRISELEKDQTLVEWSVNLERLLDECITVDREEEEHLTSIRFLLREIGEQGVNVPFEERLPLEVIREVVTGKLAEKTSAAGYLGGGVTFCSLLPMRAVPFKVVCLLGMNDGSFPRTPPRINFDLMAEKPRLGDRSLRLDDRYLFLETLISARKQFYISYVGQSVYDNSKQPPSVLVEELLDYLTRITQGTRLDSYGRPWPQKAEELITRHRLQPFHPEYFQPRSGLFSYSPADWQAARQSLKRGREGDSFDFWRDLPLPPQSEEEGSGTSGKEPETELRLEELTAFLIHPVRYFCRSRLGVELRRDDSLPYDEEPLRLEGLNLYQLGVEMSQPESLQLASGTIEEFFRARGQLPPGKMGEVALAGLRAEVQDLSRRVREYDSPVQEPLEFEVACGPHRLRGVFTDLRRDGLLQARPARVKGKDILRTWIRHLVLCILARENEGLTPASVVLGKDREVVLPRVFSAEATLTEIFDLYQENKYRPLPFFSETSHVFAREMLDKGLARAREKAKKEWLGSDRVPGEGTDPWFNFRYRQDLPLDQEFEELALKIFKPIYEHIKKA
ncbi:MAG: exodeoxyribonuclease V subunit gamma [Desulfurivibrionaceae bacterium]